MNFKHSISVFFFIYSSFLINSVVAQGVDKVAPFDSVAMMHYAPNELIVSYYKSEAPKSIIIEAVTGKLNTGDDFVNSVLNTNNVKSMKGLQTVDTVYLMKCNNCDISKLKQSLSSKKDIFKYVEYNYIGRVVSCPSSPGTTNDAVNNYSLLDQIDGRCAWNLSKGDNSVIGLVDITDYGLYHEDTNGKVLNAINNTGYHVNQHGNQMAGIMAANTNNTIGISSIGYNAKMRLYSVARDEQGGAVDLFYAAEGVNLAVQDNVDVINLSFTHRGQTMRDAVNNALSNNITVVTTVGNSTSLYNAGCDVSGVICVTAVDQNDAHGPTGHQSRSTVDLSCPDRGFLTTGTGNSYVNSFGGTSYSSAIVSGTVALMYEVNPSMTPLQAKQWLECSADDISDISDNGTTYNGLIGSGRLNAYRAVQQARIEGTEITGPIYVDPNTDYNYSLPFYSGVGYNWSVSGAATLVHGQYSNSVYVHTANLSSTFQVQCTINKGNCSQSKSIVSFNDGGGARGFQVETYPNPTSGDFIAAVVETTEAVEESTTNTAKKPHTRFELYDPFGQLVRSIQARNKAQIQTANLKKGFYTLRVTREDKSIVQRVVLK